MRGGGTRGEERQEGNGKNCVCGGGREGETAREMERRRGRERRESKEGEENDLSAF